MVVFRNTVEYSSKKSTQPPYNEPPFTVEESKGKLVDMLKTYNEFLQTDGG